VKTSIAEFFPSGTNFFFPTELLFPEGEERPPFSFHAGRKDGSALLLRTFPSREGNDVVTPSSEDIYISPSDMNQEARFPLLFSHAFLVGESWPFFFFSAWKESLSGPIGEGPFFSHPTLFKGESKESFFTREVESCRPCFSRNVVSVFLFFFAI